MEERKINVIGAGLAGCEAALQLAKSGWEVYLYEMRPRKMTPAHQTSLFAELICSNSLKSNLLKTASGLLKAELRLLGSELLKIAESNKIPAGNALAVERTSFAEQVTAEIKNNRRIKVFNKEVTYWDEKLTIIATGPLTSSALNEFLMKQLGVDNLFFYDAIAPIIATESLDFSKVFYKARYDKGSADYLNCPFTEKEYHRFVQALKESEKYLGKEFEKNCFNELKKSKELAFYENCIPIEELARRGDDTLRFGVLRPVGLEYPATGKRPFAVLQLRAENKEKSAYNMVGCQTMMTKASQKRVFRLIPGMEKVEFYRFGSIHRNTYLNSPQILNKDLSLVNHDNVYIAGQLSGVEGYVESIASGLLTAFLITGKTDSLPETTIIGQMWERLITSDLNRFVPVNANFGLLPPLDDVIRDKQKKKELMSERSLSALKVLLHNI